MHMLKTETAVDITGPMNGATAAPLRQTLADAQEKHASAALTVKYSIMFELTRYASFPDTLNAIRDYARNASISEVIGFSDGNKEDSIVVDIIARPSDKGLMLDLARMLKTMHNQREVLVSWSSVSSIIV